MRGNPHGPPLTTQGGTGGTLLMFRILQNQIVWLLIVGVWLGADRAAAQAIFDPDFFCTGDPCIITTDVEVPDGSDVNFGNRHVILAATLEIGSGSFFLAAGRLTVASTGQFRAKGAVGFDGGDLDIDIDGDIELNSTVPGGAILLDGLDGGFLVLTSRIGSITGPARISASAASDGDGGDLLIEAGKDIDLSGPIEATGGVQGSGTLDSEILAGRDLTLASLDFSGGAGDGGLLAIQAGRNATIGSGKFDGGNTGDGGELTVDAEDTLTITGTITVTSSTDPFSQGGDVSLTSTNGLIHLAAAAILDVSGVGSGGILDLDGRDVHLQGTTEVRGTNSASTGGIIDILAQDTLVVAGPVLADGGSGGFVFIDMVSGGSIDIHAEVNGEGGSFQGGNGGTVVIDAGGPVNVFFPAEILANGPGSGTGGTINIVGCTVSVASRVDVFAKNNNGMITISDGDQMTLFGDFSAGPGGTAAITLKYRNPGQTPNWINRNFNITPSVQLDITLPNCDLDNDGVLNFDDLCPHVFDPSQPDNGGVASPNDPSGSLSDGIGDACQCGDVNDDGRVTIDDDAMLREALAGAGPGLSAPEKCNVIGLADASSQDAFGVTPDCKMNDSSVMSRAFTARGPGLGEVCDPALP